MAAKKGNVYGGNGRLEEIVRQIDANELELDVLADKIKETNKIIAFVPTN